MSNPNELTVELVINLGSEAGSKVFDVAQQALLQAFKAAGSLDDLAAKLAIPIQLVTVTGAKVVVGNGYDAYKIIVAIRSDDPNRVAKELFSTGVQLATTAVTGLVLRPTMVAGPVGVALSIGGPVVAGFAASKYAESMWDDTIANTAPGQWIVGKVTDNFGLGLKVTPGSISAPTSSFDVPAANQTPRSALVLDPLDNQTKIVFNTSPSKVYDPDVIAGSNTYIVQKDESLWSIAQANGWDWGELKSANPQLTDKNFIRPGQIINGLAPVIPVNLFTPVTNTTPTPIGTTPSDATSSVSSDNSSLFSNGDYSFGGLGNVNTATGIEAYINDTIANGYRPGNHNLADEYIASNLAQTFLANPDLVNALVWDPGVKAAALNMLATGVQNETPTDPLVLDLNGDGVKLTSFGDAPVLFDIDHDGGTKEVTGWVSKEDGIVVMDLNGNGKIDNIFETMSEYFNGTVGTGGNAGTKLYANGFAALKSLDSNGDNAFTSTDSAWAAVKIWQDANHDGVTDAGELKALAALGITSVNLVTTLQSGLVNGGNEVLATGTFIQGGQTKEAQAARFIANATGNTTTVGGTGTTVAAEDGQSSYVSAVTTGEAIDVAIKGVRNIYGNSGNDTLTGDANANWLVGGQGSDAFNAGAGDDMLIIDAQDLQQNIHAGDGNDMVQVVGADGVTLNLAQAEVEVAVGGTGNDVFIGGGRSSIFIRADDGDDLIIGGAANDALSGESGNDFIDGGAGNDVIRGGRGQDQLLGGASDDVIDGGLEDDRLSGGEGNDVLIGGSGDDVLDGGAGADVAEFTGSYADYRVTKLDAATWRVVDTKTGRDGADTLTNIEQLSFADIGHFDITQPTALPVKDVLTKNALGQTLTRTGSYHISKDQLLANDLSWQGTALSITAVLDARGGTAQLITNTADAQFGNILFTPDASYKGVMSFKYQVKDSNNNSNSAVIPATGVYEQLKGTVYLQTPDLPSDPLALEQWYLSEINVIPVWQDYTGKGIRIGQFEPGGPYAVDLEVLDYTHPDLQDSVDKGWLNDLNNPVPQTFSNHATMVAGVMVAGRNGQGGIGIAYDAKVSGNSLAADFAPFAPPLTGQQIDVTGIFGVLNNMKNYDVVNASWSITGDAAWLSLTGNPDPHEQAAALGRDGLGTVIVYAAGNDRATGGNTNISNLTSQRWAITVGAVNAKDDIGSLFNGAKPFSNPGASILVSAPGSNITSAARELTNADGSIFGAEEKTSKGTSFAAPIVSGVVALMLEANPDLGYRDVQGILALTAKKISDPTGTDWVDNGSSHWNGGGMHVSHDYGFGEVDALAAVRLAETWVATGVYVTEQKLTGSVNSPAALPDGSGYIERSITIGAGVSVEHVELNIGLTAGRVGDLIVELYSPSGTKSVLLNRPGKAPGSAASDLGSTLVAGGQGAFTFSTTHAWGEDSAGTWKVRIYDAASGSNSAVGNIQLNVYGKQGTDNDNYVFTNEYASFASGTRNIITDSDGGYDTINASAISTSSSINLTSGATSVIAGKSVQLVGTFEQAFGGDGNDTLTGNADFNDLTGGRGNDVLLGGAGADFLDGGKGNDTLTGGADPDMFVIYNDSNTTDTILDFNPALAVEKILLVGFEGVEDFTKLGITLSGADSIISLGQGQTLTLKNVLPGQLSEQNFSFITKTALNSPGFDLATYKVLLAERTTSYGDNNVQELLFPATGPSSVNYFAQGGKDGIAHSGERSVLDGGDGDDLIYADYNAPIEGFDWVEGGAGVDELYAGGFADVVAGGSGNDLIFGDGGNDYLRGDSGLDAIYGGNGNDFLIGGIDADFLSGEAGDDTILLEGDTGDVTATANAYYGTRLGGIGADVFRVAATGGGGSTVALNAGVLTASNLIADFEVNQAGELIDFSDQPWIRGMADIIVSSQTLGGIQVTTISANNGANSTYVNLVGVTAAQINSAHFKFASSPGLVLSGAGNDTLTGDAGGNTLDGGAGTDAMTGRTGDDAYIVDNAGDTVNELPGGGFDTVLSSVSYTLSADVEALTLTGTANLNATGNDRRNRLHGNAGDNRLDGGAEADDMRGGAGNDTYIVDSQLDTVTENGTEGNDTVESAVSWTLGDNVENLTLTGVTAINGTGNVLANTLRGNSGDNVLDGATGADTMIGGIGNDTYYVENVGDMVTENANEGFDTVYTSYNRTLDANVENGVLYGNATTLIGNALDNTLIGNAANNTLNGGNGADQLDGGAGNDTLQGGLGDDIYFVDTSTDVVTENTGEGYDTVVSSVTRTLETNVEHLTLTGAVAINGTGNALSNVLTGNSANNVLIGGAGYDTLNGGAGADSMTGGLDDDTYYVDNTGDIVTENLNEGWDTVQSSLTHTLGANLENLYLTGTAAINGTGNALHNTLNGNSANNILTGGAGYDTLNGGAGADTMAGGTEADYYYVDDVGDIVTENVGEGQDGVESQISYTLGANLENLQLAYGAAAINGIGNTLNNYLGGNTSNNILTGLAGNDEFEGGDGLDTLVGGAGDDIYYMYASDGLIDSVVENANEGTDTVDFYGAMAGITYMLGANVENATSQGSTGLNFTGNSLNNTLTGDYGTNVLNGDAGADTLTGSGGNDTVFGGLGNDLYLFGRGDNADSWTDYDTTGGNVDTTRFGADVAHDQIWFRHIGNDLEAQIIGTADKFLVKDWYSGNANHLERFESGNGKVLLDSQVESLVAAMASFAPPSAGQTTLPPAYQTSLNPVLAANWQ